MFARIRNKVSAQVFAFSFRSSRWLRAAVIALTLLLAIVVGVLTPALTYAAPPVQSTIPSAALTPELLASLAAIFFSLVFAYVPRVSTWYNALDGEYKASIMGGVIIAVGLAAFGLSCGGFIALEGVACTQTGIVAVIQVILFALIANVGSYTLLVKPFRKSADTLPP